MRRNPWCGVVTVSEFFHDATFERSLPAVLQNDHTMGIIGRISADAMRRFNGKLTIPTIWSRIDELDEDTLDILAYDLHIDWWRYAASLKSKRANLKNAMRIHSIMGTRAAVELAAALCTDGKVSAQEWYEYQGDPGFFRIRIANAVLTDYDDLIAIVFKVKRCSAWLDDITFVSEPMEGTAHYAGAFGAYSRTVLPEWRMDQSFTGTVNIVGVFAVRSRTALPPVK